ncbi:MAG: helix-turn-helix domain-containing protein, partial [Erysipelotrichaceae bacterium]
MNKAYKFRIYPNTEQQILFAKTFGCVRFVYNRMLSDKINHYEKTKENLYCYPSQYKSEFEWLKEVDSLALVGAYNNLKSAYNNFFRDKKIGFPKFKSKKNHHLSYTTNCVNGNIR